MKDHDLNRVAVDFDGTLVEGVWPDRGIGSPIPIGMEKFQDLVDYSASIGQEVWVYTARGWADEPAIRTWLDEHGFPDVKVQCGKLLFRYLVDDRAMHSDTLSWIKA